MLDFLTQTLEENGQEAQHFDQIIPTVVRPSTRDIYASTDQTRYEIGIVRQFTFSSALQRMSVITRTLGENHMDLYVKGAPEKIISLCLPNTVPQDFHEVLHRHTLQGFRVIAFAWKQLDPKLPWHQAQKIHRDQVECELKFLGLLIMQNTLKPETTPIIHQLQMANIRTVMVTGDNMLTAVCVARECKMIHPTEKVILVNATAPDGDSPAQISWEYAESGTDGNSESEDQAKPWYDSYHSIRLEELPHTYHFAISGKSFGVMKQHFPELVQKLCMRGTVFARMSPDQKSQLIEELQEMDYMVGMCGDGANDCGALKTAHTGISLSEAEASVASPFTSTTPNISCVPNVVKEGRAALVTSFGVFKYMALYSMIQFISVIMLYTVEENLGDFQFLYLDLIVTTTVAFLMGHTEAYSKLVPKRPQGHLLSFPVLLSIILQILVSAFFQFAMFMYIRAQPWYFLIQSSFNNEHIGKSFEGTIIFCFSSFEYLICAFCFSTGPPYRKRLWTNWPYLLSLIALTLMGTYLWMKPAHFLEDFMIMIHISDKLWHFKATVVLCAVGNLLVSVIIEEFIIDSWLMRAVHNLVKRRNSSSKLYKQIDAELNSKPNWPPVGEVTSATRPLNDVDRSISLN